MRWPRRAARRAWGSLIEPLWFTLWPAAGAQVDEQSVALRHGLEEGGVLPLDVAERERVIAALRLLAPHAAAQIVAEADRICRHTFDLLGSGPVALGARIDWHRDFASGHRWPERSYYRRIRPAPYPGGYDIKVPWELSRGHHLVRLGQAYWLTGDERYAREFAAEVEHWITANPWPRGVNWACTMEVAIRAINWLWAYHLVRGAGALTDAFERRLLASLLQHGRHILRNLENEEGFTNNHYLADLVGLIHLGVLCPWADEAVTWREVGLRELWAAVEHQVYPDGVYFEASIAYHRLALELILLAVALCRRNRMAVPEAVMTRLERMLEVVTSYTRPDGTAPAIGDADNGRILRLATWQDPGREWADHRYLLAIGAALLGRADLAQAAEGQWQEALWLLGPEAVARARARAEAQPALTPRSRAFPVGGLYVMRHRGLHLIVDAGGNAQNGFGGHAHNDTLSFELYAHGRSWIVDPGTYVYTADYRARDRFRSTAYHNVVVVDGQELNRFRKRSAFGLHEDADPRVNAWQSAADHDLLDASHRGYERLERPVLCRRQVYFSKEEGFWAVRDLLTGRGMHLLTLHLHLAQVETRLERGQAPTCLHLADGAAALDVYFLAPEGAAVSLGSGEVSRSYGVKSSAPVVSVSVRSALPVQFLLLLVPSRTTEPPLRWEQVRAMAARLPFGQPEESVRAHPSVPAPGLQPDALRYA